jgi:predicted RNA-binding Zn ribbon-like protein
MGDIKITPGKLALLGGRLCLDFCNTIERRTEPHDFLVKDQYAAFVYWCEDTALIRHNLAERYTAWHAANPNDAQRLFEDAIDLRESIYQVGLAVIQGQPVPELALAVVNKWTQQAAAARQLHVLDGKFIWQWIDDSAPERPLWEIALSASQVFLEDDLTRLRQCPGCGWLFYDQSKNNTRTWCDMRFCGNRSKNKRFHTRQKQSQT